MNESVSLELDNQERDIVVRGLRYIRNAIAFAVEDPTEDSQRVRTERIREVEQLISRINGTPTQSAAKV